jgi:hypothetical protein
MKKKPSAMGGGNNPIVNSRIYMKSLTGLTHKKANQPQAPMVNSVPADKAAISYYRDFQFDSDYVFVNLFKNTVTNTEMELTVKVTKQTWPDGKPVTKNFERTGNKKFVLPAGAIVSGATFLKPSGTKKLHVTFVHESVWYECIKQADALYKMIQASPTL